MVSDLILKNRIKCSLKTRACLIHSSLTPGDELRAGHLVAGKVCWMSERRRERRRKMTQREKSREKRKNVGKERRKKRE